MSNKASASSKKCSASWVCRSSMVEQVSSNSMAALIGNAHSFLCSANKASNLQLALSIKRICRWTAKWGFMYSSHRAKRAGPRCLTSAAFPRSLGKRPRARINMLKRFKYLYGDGVRCSLKYRFKKAQQTARLSSGPFGSTNLTRMAKILPYWYMSVPRYLTCIQS